MTDNTSVKLPVDFLHRVAQHEASHLTRLYPIEKEVVVSTRDGSQIRLENEAQKSGYVRGMRNGILAVIHHLGVLGAVDELSVARYNDLLKALSISTGGAVDSAALEYLEVREVPSKKEARLAAKKAFIRDFVIAARQSKRSADNNSKPDQRELIETASSLYDMMEAVKE